ncbi:MAG: hypothetical protein N0A16_05705 [Blastocatellia bacterium]|nr:hypothetical protein [Blastocatellia bacterium]MCX7752333.1 hypothetical protein [Blastocatellia bacterium]MDW8167214.1 hypothetical protein [Acidobacteriota bacterium]
MSEKDSVVEISRRSDGSELRLMRVDKIGSATVNLKLSPWVPVTTRCEARAGNVVVVRVLTENATYNHLELPTGRLCKINRNDLIVGVLGERRALKGFVGDIPPKLSPGDRLHILNLGGVIGRCVDHYNELGEAIEVELLGMVADEDGAPVPAILNIAKGAIPPREHLERSCPLVLVAGTCMSAGKTFAAAQLIKHFTHVGYRVAAAKLTGIACLRDTLNMEDHGAIKTLSFLDCGYPSTVSAPNLPAIAKALIAELNTVEPDVIVLELGDGIIGGYNVHVLFEDAELLRFVAATVFCASDFVGAWGGVRLLAAKRVPITVISGAVTDSAMGREFIEREWGIPAANAMRNGEKLYRLVEEKVLAFRNAAR